MDSGHHNNHTDGWRNDWLFRRWTPWRLDWPETNLLYVNSYSNHIQYRGIFLRFLGNVCICSFHAWHGCWFLHRCLPEYHYGVCYVNVATNYIWDTLLVCRGRMYGFSHVPFQVLEGIAYSISGVRNTRAFQLVVGVNEFALFNYFVFYTSVKTDDWKFLCL